MADETQPPHIPDFLPPDLDAIYGTAPTDRVDRPNQDAPSQSNTNPPVPIRPLPAQPPRQPPRTKPADPDRWFSRPATSDTTFGGALRASGTPGTYGLIIVFLALWGLALIAPNLANYLVFNPLEVVHRPWTLLSASFVHQPGFFHLAFSAIYLVIMGRFMEPILGTRDFLLVFLVSAFGANTVQYLFSFTSIGPFAGAYGITYGAMGAIFGLFGAYLVLILANRRSATPVLVLLGLNIILAFAFPSITWFGNAGGFLTGTGVMAALYFGAQRGQQKLFTSGVIVLLVSAVLVKTILSWNLVGL